MRNRSANPSWASRSRYSGARAQCSRRNRSGSPTQRRSALSVGAVGIAAKAAVRDVGPIGVATRAVGGVGAVHAVGAVGAVRVRTVGVAAAGAVGGVGSVHAVGAVGAVPAVGAVGAVHAVGAVGAIRVPAVGVAAGGIGLVDPVAGPRAGGAALRGRDVVVPEGWVVCVHRGPPYGAGRHDCNLPPPSPAALGGIGEARRRWRIRAYWPVLWPRPADAPVAGHVAAV